VKVHNYTQIQDNTGLPHHVAAMRAWDHHMKRNDSVIVDLFQVIFLPPLLSLFVLICNCDVLGTIPQHCHLLDMQETVGYI